MSYFGYDPSVRYLSCHGTAFVLVPYDRQKRCINFDGQCYIHWCNDRDPTCVSGFVQRNIIQVLDYSNGEALNKLETLMDNLRNDIPVNETNVTYLIPKGTVVHMLKAYLPFWGKWTRMNTPGMIADPIVSTDSISHARDFLLTCDSLF